LTQSTGLGGVLRSVAHVSGAHVLNGLLGIIFVPVALSRLGEAGYGALSVYWFAISYLALAELGVGKNLLREVASVDPDARRDGLQHALSAYMVVGLAVAAAAPLLAWAVPRWVIPFPPEMYVAIGALVVIAVADYLLGIVVSLHAINAMAAGRFSQYAAFQSASGILRWGGGLAVIVAVPSVGPVLVAAVFAARRFVEIPMAMAVLGRLPAGTWSTWRPSLRVGRTLARSSTLSVAQIMQTSVISAGSVLIGHTAGPAALGLFRACFDLASKLWFVSNAFGLVLFPKFAHMQASEGGRRALAGVLPGALMASATLLAGVGVAGVFVSAPILAVVGIRGELVWAVFALSLGGVALHAHGNVPYELLQANGRFGDAARIAALALTAILAAFGMLAASGITPLLALGWAWLASQALFTLSCRYAVSGLLGVRRGPGRLADEALATAALAAACAAAITTPGGGRAAWIVASVGTLAIMLWRLLPVIPRLRAGAGA
jgi:O-antigen/teichoic acid export membrane protein